jgi:ABC-type lipoprotein release transport system permease subunit
MRRPEYSAVRAIHRRVTRGDAQRGALSLFVAIMFTGMVLIIGLVGVLVGVQTTYRTKVLSIIGADSFPIKVSGTATLVTGQQQPNSEQP